MAQLYWDLDGVFTHMAWLLPAWLPLPSFKKRDEAHLRVKEIFYNAIQTRKQSENKEGDMLDSDQLHLQVKFRFFHDIRDYSSIANIEIARIFSSKILVNDLVPSGSPKVKYFK